MERTLDAKGRWRNRTVGFRVSEEEAKLNKLLYSKTDIPEPVISSPDFKMVSPFGVIPKELLIYSEETASSR